MELKCGSHVVVVSDNPCKGATGNITGTREDLGVDLFFVQFDEQQVVKGIVYGGLWFQREDLAPATEETAL